MGELLRFRGRSGSFDGRRWMDLGREAQKEIDRLIRLQPEFKGLKAEIESRFEAADHTENLLAVLDLMMAAKIRILEENLELTGAVV